MSPLRLVVGLAQGWRDVAFWVRAGYVFVSGQRNVCKVFEPGAPRILHILLPGDAGPRITPKLMCDEHDDRLAWQHQGDEVLAFWLIQGSSK